jgi:hypothetical protein
MKQELNAKREFDIVMMLLGALFAVPTIVSLIQHVLDVGLNWYFADFIEFYRRIITPAVDFVQAPIRWLIDALHIRWVIPVWFKDLHALSFIGAGIMTRGLTIAGTERGFQGAPLLQLLVIAVMGFIGLGLLVMMILPLVLTGALDNKDDEVDVRENSAIRRVALVTVGAVVAFYIGNAAVPGLLGR